MNREWRRTPGATVLPGTGSPARRVWSEAAGDDAVAPAPAPVPPPRTDAPVTDGGAGDAPAPDAVLPRPRVRVLPARPGSEQARWISYFDAVEQAALTLAEEVAAGRTPQWPDLIMPGTTLPAALTDRRDEVLTLIEEVTARAERRRDTIAGELAALAPPPRQDPHAAGATLGHSLDVVG